MPFSTRISPGWSGLARLLGSDDPEDTPAEGFAQLFRAWDGLRDEQAALGYVRSTVVRLCSNRRRHLLVVDRHLRDERPGSQEPAEASALKRFDDQLVAAVGGLTQARRTAVVLRYYADL